MRTLRDCCPLFWLVVPGTRTRASRTLFLLCHVCICMCGPAPLSIFFLPLLKLACKRNNTRFSQNFSFSPFVNQTCFTYWVTRVHSKLTMYVSPLLVACMWFLIAIILDQQSVHSSRSGWHAAMWFLIVIIEQRGVHNHCLAPP